MMLTEPQLRDAVLFLMRLEKVVDYDLIIDRSQITKYNIRLSKKICFKHARELLVQSLEKKKKIYANPLADVLNSLFKALPLLTDTQGAMVMNTGQIYKEIYNLIWGLFSYDVIPQNSYKFEEFSDLNLNWLRKIRNRLSVGIDRAMEFHYLTHYGKCPTFLYSLEYHGRYILDLQRALKCCEYYNEEDEEYSSDEEPEFIKYNYENYQPALRSQYESKINKYLIFTEKSEFKDELEFWAKKLAIPYKILEDVDVWLRDIIIDSKNNNSVYVRSKFFSKDGRVSYNEKKWRDWIETNTFLENSSYYCGVNYLPSYNEKRYISSEMLGRPVKKTIRAMEGGNMFFVENLFGQEWYIIGVNVLLNELDIHNMKNPMQYIRYTDSVLYSNNPIFRRYKKILGSENIIWLFQWVYHLDLQMGYIGKGIFILHSFTETLSYLRRQGITNKTYIKNMKTLEKIFEPIVERIEAVLSQNGFKVIKCCAMLYAANVELTELRPNHMFDVSSSFINGVNVQTKAGKCIYFTMDSPDVMHKNYFSQILETLDVLPIFLKMNRSTAFNTVRELARLDGALRCQTNWVNF